jgi:hypothetical protein
MPRFLVGAKHCLTSIPTSTYSATTKSARKFTFWLATQSVSLSLETDIGSLMVTLKPDFQQMSRKELRTYVLTHREDEEALRIYSIWRDCTMSQV